MDLEQALSKLPDGAREVFVLHDVEGYKHEEIGDILGKPRTCTVKARTQTTVIKYDNGDMENVIREHPEIAIKIFKTLASRLERTTQKLADVTHVSTVWSIKYNKS